MKYCFKLCQGDKSSEERGGLALYSFRRQEKLGMYNSYRLTVIILESEEHADIRATTDSR